jgi:Tfp pilus assembly protein PilW
MRSRNNFKNSMGASLIEILIGATLGVLVLGVVISIYIKEDEVISRESEETDIRAKGRHLIKFLAEEVRMAGFGLPPGMGVTDISTANSVTFRSNLFDVRTTTPPGSEGTNAITSGANSITVVNGSEFADADNIVIYDPNFRASEFNTVSGSPTSTSIPIGTVAGSDFTYSKNSKLVTINKYNTVILYQDGTAIKKSIDGTVSTLISDPSISSLQFTFDSGTAADVTKIEISLEMVDPNDTTEGVIEFESDIALRNSG